MEAVKIFVDALMLIAIVAMVSGLLWAAAVVMLIMYVAAKIEDKPKKE